MTMSLYKRQDMKILINSFSPFSAVGQLHFWIDADCNGCDLTAELEVGKEDTRMSLKSVRKASFKATEISGKIIMDFCELYIRPLAHK